MIDIQTTTLRTDEEKKKEEEEDRSHIAKYNGLPITLGGHKKKYER